MVKQVVFVGLLLSAIAFACACVSAETVIKYAHWNALPADPYNYVKAFEEKNPDIKVEFIQIPEAEYSQKLRSMAMTGTAPDVLCLWEADLADFVRAGWVLSLDEYMKGSKELRLDDFIPAVKQLMELQGSLYGLPWCFATEIAYYNKDLFDKAGVAYPGADWTWEDFENLAKKLTIESEGKVDQWGCDAIGFQGLWYSLAGAFGDKIVDEKGRFSMGSGTKEFLNRWVALTNAKVVASPQITTSGVVSADLFMAGKAAMAFNGSWMTSVYKDIQDFAWDIVPLPKAKRSYSTLHTGFFAINAQSGAKDAVWRFIEFCMSEEGQKLINTAYSNPSARLSLLKKGYYKVEGPKGPRNWDTIERTAEFAEWGYVLLPPGLTFDIVKDFNAAVLGQMSVDDVVRQAVEKAIDILGEDRVVTE
ncbi:MAG: sugar ABC transporter substrate-binding protein [Candidatus Caldatribacterium sp.]|uniref:ABC transporter substrate-binding protein n=1 Tax=Candidatus Caldatribacterium sp. TaxID=2282143 RepID=UPI002999CC8F|nr:sugar ABC transporter substrate-binding protein [Candidatus Caldatribacterium sp.]MCX7731277.1 sugar ABC transporter substrate-binding protein [Candidatus Caldatribacterium sp.]MDW8081121.1 sugar ABC transporter substrate-binding protein [Candidatus Calescibacterium sp.]